MCQKRINISFLTTLSSPQDDRIGGLVNVANSKMPREINGVWEMLPLEHVKFLTLWLLFWHGCYALKPLTEAPSALYISGLQRGGMAPLGLLSSAFFCLYEAKHFDL